MKLILASRSPRRKELLKELCPAFEVCPALWRGKNGFSPSRL